MERTILLAALQTVKPALASRDVIEELTHVWFDKEHVTASNDVGLGIQTNLKSGLTGGVRGTLLLSLLANSTAKEVELEVPEDEDALLLKAGRTRLSLSILPVKQMMAEVPDVAKAKAFKVPADLLEAFSKVLISCGNVNSAMAEQLGVTIILSGDTVQVFATDDDTIAWVTCPPIEGLKLTKESRVTIPTSFVEQMLAISKGGEVSLFIGKDSIFAKNDKTLVFSRVVNVESPTDFMKIAADTMKDVTYVTIPPRLKLALARASIMLDKGKETTITLKTDGAVLRLKAETAMGELKDTIALDGEVPAVTTILEPDLIKRGLALCKRMSIGKKATVMTGDGFTYFIASKG